MDAPKANEAEAKQLYSHIFRATFPTSHVHSLDREEIEKLYPAGETVAHERLENFIKHKVKTYHISRGELKDAETGALDPYISNGIISARQCVAAARVANGNKIFVGNPGVLAWVKDLAWKVGLA